MGVYKRWSGLKIATNKFIYIHKYIHRERRAKDI